MKITEISKEYLEKGGLIRRKGWAKDISISFNEGTITGEKKLTVDDITSDDWELTGKSTQVWKPEEGETYFYIRSLGDVAQDTFNPSFDKYRLSFKNCFKTRKEAEHILEKIKILNKLRELSNVDFNEDFDEQKWYITYNHRTESIECDTTYHVQRMPFCIYFKNQEDCGKAIDTIGEYDLKKYYFDVKEEE